MFPYINSSYYYVVIALQVVCIFHAVKTNRKDWLYLLIFLPLVGCAIYFFREILPGLRTDQLASDVQYTFNPTGRIKELERAVRISDTDANKLALAAEYARQRQYPRAIELVRSCLVGIYEHDAGMTQELARLLFYNNEFTESVQMFHKALKLKNNRFDKPEDDLLFARALDGNKDLEKAEEEYQKVIRLHHSMQARYYYGLMLKALGRSSDARTQFQTILDEKDLHPKHVRRMNAEWVQKAKREL